ncbi:MAG: hypothetical protein HYS60_02165 [Candidatus Wildermuthbacteria bacterium]|nr:hypothetical protein [Candidatus Wildermuthbacteria bacterium]
MGKIIRKIAVPRLGFIFLLIAAIIILDEARKGVPLFTFSDIYALRPTHEKFGLFFLLGGLYLNIKSRKSS